MLDFLGIGAQKAGTTWIYHQLAGHPQVAFPAGKEVHFWDRHRDRGTQWWLALFGQSGPGDVARDGREVRRGEITPAYAVLDPFTVREIAQLCPQARIFYSLRNPVARAWSAALMDAVLVMVCPPVAASTVASIVKVALAAFASEPTDQIPVR